MSIDAEGILVSCFRGETRIWEFHPDDVTSIGCYRKDSRTNELITTLNKDFEIPDTTKGLKELNERLSRELKTHITIGQQCGSSPFGVVLWPSHLAGSALWEFWTIGKDGLASYVAPETPNALRQLSSAIRREMARFAKPLPVAFPQTLVERGFIYHGDIGWTKEDAVTAVEWLQGNGAAIVEVEVWFVENGVPQSHGAGNESACHHWTITQPGETWEAFASRGSNEARAFIRRFRLPEGTGKDASPDVHFHISWVWREWLEEGDFRFPEKDAEL
jgi:hypothetical protein